MGEWVWLLALVIALVSAGASAAALYLAAQRPTWQRDVDRKMKVLEDEWEDVLDRIKRRGDRLSKERGLLAKKESPQPENLTETGGKAKLWALKRAKEAK